MGGSKGGKGRAGMSKGAGKGAGKKGSGKKGMQQAWGEEQPAYSAAEWASWNGDQYDSDMKSSDSDSDSSGSDSDDSTTDSSRDGRKRSKKNKKSKENPKRKSRGVVDPEMQKSYEKWSKHIGSAQRMLSSAGNGYLNPDYAEEADEWAMSESGSKSKKKDAFGFTAHLSDDDDDELTEVRMNPNFVLNELLKKYEKTRAGSERRKKIRHLLTVEKYWQNLEREFHSSGIAEQYASDRKHGRPGAEQHAKYQKQRQQKQIVSRNILVDMPHPRIDYSTTSVAGCLKVKSGGRADGASSFKTREVSLCGNRLRITNAQGFNQDVFFTPATKVERAMECGPFCFRLHTGTGECICFDAINYANLMKFMPLLLEAEKRFRERYPQYFDKPDDEVELFRGPAGEVIDPVTGDALTPDELSRRQRYMREGVVQAKREESEAQQKADRQRREKRLDQMEREEKYAARMANLQNQFGAAGMTTTTTVHAAGTPSSRLNTMAAPGFQGRFFATPNGPVPITQQYVTETVEETVNQQSTPRRTQAYTTTSAMPQYATTYGSSYVQPTATGLVVPTAPLTTNLQVPTTRTTTYVNGQLTDDRVIGAHTPGTTYQNVTMPPAGQSSSASKLAATPRGNGRATTMNTTPRRTQAHVVGAAADVAPTLPISGRPTTTTFVTTTPAPQTFAFSRTPVAGGKSIRTSAWMNP